MNSIKTTKMSNFRWVICALLFLATTVNYMDRQVLSLTWKDFISPEFRWTDDDYGTITAIFSIFYAIANLFAGKFIDWMGTKKGYLIAISVWSLGAVLHAFSGIMACGVLTGNWLVGFDTAKELIAGYIENGTVSPEVENCISLFGNVVPTAMLAVSTISV